MTERPDDSRAFRTTSRLFAGQVLAVSQIALTDAERAAARCATMRPQELVVMTTGSQGEPMSGLTRMSNRDHRNINIEPGDTVIVSASPIPGNEEMVHRTINRLLQRGAEAPRPGRPAARPG